MVGTLCVSGQAMNKAGYGVNIISGSALAEEFIKEAEGNVCAISRYDFVTNYTDINTIGKELLRDVTSNLAGIYLIQYDMGGYKSRIEAEDKINICRDAALRGLSIIRDTKTQEWMGAK